MLQLESVEKSYGNIRALRNVTLELHRGEIFGYVGPNGAGKTTTIKIVTGLIRDYRGTVRINGVDTRKDPGALQRAVGYVPQDAGFQEWRTVEHALNTFGLLSGLSGKMLHNAIDRSLETAGIAEHRKRRIIHLSGGTVQRLRFAQALLHDPALLVLDEPLSGLDPSSRHQVTRSIMELGRQNRLVFVSSHILSELEGLATSIGFLHNGRIIERGTPRELRDRHDVGNVIRLETVKPLETRQIEDMARPPVERMEKSGPLEILLHIRPDAADDAMPEILRRLVSGGVSVQSVSRLQPSLEDVYLKLTEEHES